MTMTMDVDSVHAVSLSAPTDSVIAGLSLYTDRARITRAFEFKVLAGSNKVTIMSLPNVIDHESIRVEGRGPATIQGVTSTKTPIVEPEAPPRLTELQFELSKIRNSLQRAKKALKAIDGFMEKIDVEHLDISELGEAMDIYDITEEKWDDKVLDLEKKLVKIDEEIKKEEQKMEEVSKEKWLRGVVVVNLFAEEDADLKLNLNYAVSHASWEAAYDVRIDSESADRPAKVVYKADIFQETGEDWVNAPITLETAQPTFGVTIPRISIWNITHTAPSGSGRGGLGLGRGGAKRHRRIMPDADDRDYCLYDTMVVTSSGHVNATFRIPGFATIPTMRLDENMDEDDQKQAQKRTVTIATLELKKEMSWECIPKGDARVHLKATVKNESEYTFLPGRSDVYVDQSFVARVDMPAVSPKEVFDCPLGLDPSIRVTYHPLSKHIKSSGFYTKSITHSFVQRISIHNTKSIAIQNVKLSDHIPVSEDGNITVSLIDPALPTPPATVGSSVSTSSTKMGAGVQVSEGVVAQWRGADDSSADATALGKDGKVDWICALPAFGKTNLVLQWEVSTTQKEKIYGL